jgi:hypothetical protein
LSTERSGKLAFVAHNIKLLKLERKDDLLGNTCDTTDTELDYMSPDENESLDLESDESDND